ncbi:hypothetical protein SEA_MABODAMACA_61 [Microbacterium phage Mabodamaca]|uniref:Uncharacterized protein n=1 Tax=Microbacterium phage Mabodamaca TaxID=3078574 RepID=A0AA96NEN7_9CAUD|nr:hypothetical protein SEA_MABODAMACA_61 [Microbacterium phage Mabodamaca]
MSATDPQTLTEGHPLGSETRTNILLMSIATSLYELTQALPALVSPEARAASIREALAGTEWVAAEGNPTSNPGEPVSNPEEARLAPVTTLPAPKAKGRKKATEASGA